MGLIWALCLAVIGGVGKVASEELLEDKERGSPAVAKNRRNATISGIRSGVTLPSTVPAGRSACSCAASGTKLGTANRSSETSRRFHEMYLRLSCRLAQSII